MPLSGSDLALTPARLGVMRLGAGRLGSYQPTVVMTINGIVRRPLTVEGLSIQDIEDGLPNTATLRVSGFTPIEGQEIKIGLGGLDRGQLLFAGHILAPQQVYVGSPANIKHDLSCISYEWLLNGELVNGAFAATSATDIVLWIMGHTSGFSTAGVEAGLPVIDEITFTDVEVTDALERVKERIGGTWVVDYVKTLHFGLAIQPWPSPIHAVTTADAHSMEGVVRSVDLSQVRTRQPVEGGGVNAIVEVAPGETILPVDDISWYSAVGGTVKSGPQRISYTGIAAGGTGGLVGPGAAPSSASAVAQAAGSGVESGVHGYAVTFTTAGGESVPGPTSALTVGVVDPPVAAPAPSSLSAGGSVTDGDHDYAVTFVTATGETTAGPLSSQVTTGGALAAPPASGPVCGTQTAGGSVETGSRSYKVTFTTAAGETAPGPAGTGTSDEVAPSAGSGLAAGNSSGGSMVDGNYIYTVTFTTPSGETVIAVNSAIGTVSGGGGNGSMSLTVINTSADPRVTGRKVYRTPVGGGAFGLVGTIGDNTTTTFTDTTASGAEGAAPPATSTAVYRTIPLSSIPTGPSGTTGRKIYRLHSGTYKLLATLANNSSTTYTDTTADAGLGAAAPSGTTLNTVNLTGIPLGNAAVTARKLYRRSGGAGLKLLATIADNVTTTYADTTANGSLGAAAPSTNTATANRVSVSGIPIGGATVTGRKLYRTAAAGAQLKLLATIADNVTTTYADSTADGSLGANAPTSDTSGLAQPEGQVAAGSATLPVANAAGFSAAGGWAVIGNGRQVIRFTGITGSTLTGIPTSGAGSIVASIGYNSTVTQAPALIGVPASGPGSVQYRIRVGDPINLFAVVDDVAAQGVIAVLLSTPTREHSGIVDAPLLQDRRLSLAEMLARGAARLSQIKDPLVTLRYRTRDMTTRSGREVTFALDAPASIAGTFKVQRVTVSQFQGGHTRPWRTVEASSRRLSFEALLRLIKAA